MFKYTGSELTLLNMGFKYEPLLEQFYKVEIGFWSGKVHIIRINENTKEILLNNPTTLYNVVPITKNKIFKRLLKRNLIKEVTDND